MLYCGPHRRRVELELVDRASVRETVNPHAAIGATHHFCLADAVVGAFERIGERGTLEAGWIGEDIGDRASCKLFIVEGQGQVRQQHAVALSGDHARGLFCRYAFCFGEPLGLPVYEGGARLRRVAGEPVRRLCLQLAQP